MNLRGLMRHNRWLSVSLILFTLSVGILIGTLVGTQVTSAKGQAVAPDASPLTIPSPSTLPSEFTKLAKQVEPSVVNITTDYTPRTSRGGKKKQQREEDEEDDLMAPFRRFFQGPFGEMPMRPFRQEATGSGFIVDKNGYIITNHHVIERADHIKVKIPGDRTEYKARVIGFDRETDIAVIKVDTGRPLQPVKIGNSDGVQVGDYAVAIGSPFGLEASVTAGIISATGRDVPGAQQFQRFIQTDAAINPGNSGGPLLNIRGEVIGVNTAIATRSGGYQGIGFALPINTAVRVYNQVIKTGRVTRGSIGVSWSKNEKPEVLKALGLTHGVLVESVEPGGPAEKAGIKPEDVIIAMNGKPIKDGDDLVARVADTPVGTEVVITVDRGGQKLDKKVIIGDRALVFANNPRIRGSAPEEPPARDDTEAKFGIYVKNFSDAEKESKGFEDKRGVLVTRVEPDSFAEEIGLRPNDVIVSINRQPVSSTDDVRRIQSSLKPGDAVAFRIMRPMTGMGGRGRQTQWQGMFLAGTLPAK
jgi:serine protease Do